MDTSVSSTPVKSEILSTKVTLAPLPLFNTSDSFMNQNKHGFLTKRKKMKRKKKKLQEDIQYLHEHRENLNERLKREFGFDFSESPTQMLPKSKSNNQTSSNLNVTSSNLNISSSIRIFQKYM
ncbi:inactive histone-lysine N-methyltransferase 2E [Caerostris extrusa]|uniref:Inactive histone-lysine N-methyltransferase 2E n=1 Tax=Caerostris extrusa TaxID=172846 RepID=A0AAV4P1K7_CAEEX|nr:inactive histone-lysine N-methyltransferase 2E [Caerostris extrusa]